MVYPEEAQQPKRQLEVKQRHVRREELYTEDRRHDSDARICARLIGSSHAQLVQRWQTGCGRLYGILGVLDDHDGLLAMVTGGFVTTLKVGRTKSLSERDLAKLTLGGRRTDTSAAVVVAAASGVFVLSMSLSCHTLFHLQPTPAIIPLVAPALNMEVESLSVPLPPPPSPPVRAQSAPARDVSHSHFSWDSADAAHLGPSRITITRLYQRATKAPYHRLESHIKTPASIVPPSPGPQKKKRCAVLDAGPNPFRSDDFLDDSDVQDDAPPLSLQDLRSSSAPPEDTSPPESAPPPRISDDTAILHAFLNRAAASKRPIPAAKRESLENRRDSDVVRQALASTDKPEPLAELDPNSPPSPQKSQSPVIETEVEVEKPLAATEAQPATSTRSKAPRRTTRTRAPPPSQTKPAKIAIRSAADHVALKRSEAQELALLTRSNTRKNKGKSVMPVARLLKIASEDAPADVPVESTEGQDDSRPVRRGVQWDQTLAYYKEFESDLADSPPTKPKSRQTRVSARALEPLAPPVEEPSSSAPEAASSEPATAEPDVPASVVSEQPQTDAPAPQQPQLPRPASNKRKSRIATPARPTKIAPVKADRSAPHPPALHAPALAGQTEAPQENRLGTPKKPHTPFFGIKPTSSLSSRLDLPPKHDVAPFAPAAPALPGLSSPAKKRVKSTLGKSAVRPSQKDAELPGLTSPAKRKRSGIKFS